MSVCLTVSCLVMLGVQDCTTWAISFFELEYEYETKLLVKRSIFDVYISMLNVALKTQQGRELQLYWCMISLASPCHSNHLYCKHIHLDTSFGNTIK